MTTMKAIILFLSFGLFATSGYAINPAELTIEAFEALTPAEQQAILQQLMAEQENQHARMAEIAADQTMLLVWSQQLDSVTSLLQQLIACIQKGSINVNEKTKVLATLQKYIGLIQDFQLHTTTSEQETLFRAVTVSKSIIDHLTTAVSQGLDSFAIPDSEYLMSPAKNATVSREYIEQTLAHNVKKLNDLETQISRIGLTFFNQALRTTEEFVTAHKRPLLLTTALATAGIAYYNRDALSAHGSAFKDYIADTVNPPINLKTGEIAPDGTRLPLNLAFAKTLSVGAITVAIFRDQLTKLGNALVDNSITKSQYYWYRTKNKVSDLYMRAKGISVEKKDGIFTKIGQVKLSDCVGLEDQKAALFKVVDYLEKAEQYIRADTEIEKGILLAGPSGSGKTMLVKALAAEINQLSENNGLMRKIKVIELNHEELNLRGVQLISWIREAMTYAPCILFIDELHLYGLKKDGDKVLLNKFLTQMQELHNNKDPNKQVFIIGATNHPELLAPELFKHKRFGTLITFKNPTIIERKTFFATMFEKYGISHPSIDIDSIVLQTHECSYGHLQQIIKDARFIARSLGQPVQHVHLQQAVNTLVHGIAPTSALTAEEARIASADQAGKTLAHMLLGIPETIQLVTINKVVNKIKEEQLWWATKKEDDSLEMQYGKLITTTECEEIKDSSPENLERLSKRFLAGGCAQKMINGRMNIDYSAQDYQNATLLAQKIVTRGLPISALPDQQRTNICRQTEELVQRFEREIQELLTTHAEKLNALTHALHQEKIITGDRIAQLLK